MEGVIRYLVTNVPVIWLLFISSSAVIMSLTQSLAEYKDAFTAYAHAAHICLPTEFLKRNFLSIKKTWRPSQLSAWILL